MLTQLEVFGIAASSPPKLTLPFGDILGVNPIQIRGIDGLGPAKASIITTALASSDGERYSGSSIEKRNIVITMGLNPDWAEQTIESLRMELYKYFMPQLGVLLRFTSTHLPTCDIYGYVESLEPNIFSKDPEIQVSVICPNPDFFETDPTVLNGAVNDLPMEVNYIGSIPTPLKLTVSSSAARPAYSGPLSALIIADSVIQQSFALSTVTIDDTGNLELSSEPGNKYVHINYFAANPVSLLSAMDAGSVWPTLQAGQNQFQVNADLAGQTWEMEYHARFGGL